MSVVEPYRTILSRPGTVAFSVAGVIARLPTSMAGLGIVLMVQGLYDSYALAGRVSAAYVLAQAFIAPQIAKVVDRRGQAAAMRPLVALTAAAQTGLIVAATAHAGQHVLYVLAVLGGATIGSFGALTRARWSHLLDDPRQLHTAYSFESVLDEVVFVVGPIVATVVATSITPAAGLAVPVAAVVVGGYWFLSQRDTEPPPQARLAHAPGRPRGRVLTPGMVAVVLAFVAVGSIFGSTDVSTIAFAEEEGSQGAAGAILAVFAAGSLLSGLGYGARHWTSPLWRRFAIGMAGLGIGVSAFFLVTSLPLLAAVMFLTGFAIAPTLITGNGLVRALVPAGRLTEGLTWVGTALGVGVSAGAWLAGTQIDRGGAHAGFRVVVLAAVVAVAITLLSVPALRARAGDAT